jgi:DNA repair protein RecN (Recombination protein N)
MNSKFYLNHLIIQNFATFRNQRINFRAGFNAIVGETGSGKSLVLDALELILGGRSDKKVVRKDTDYSLLEATFNCSHPEIKSYLEDEGFPMDKELVIKRLIYRNGSSKNYINHLSCTVSFLAQFARKYIDIVGQFENQKLLSESYQLQLLDQYLKLKPKLETYRKKLKEFKLLQAKQEELLASRNHREQRLDFINYQLQEIEKLNPSSQDEDENLRKKNNIVNLERVQKTCHLAKALLEGEEGQLGLLAQVRALHSVLLKNLEDFQGGIEMLSTAEDLMHQIDKMVDKKLNTEFDPAELDEVLERLDFYQRLKKKFSGTTEGILQAQVDFLKEKSQLESLEFDLEANHEELSRLQRELTQIADELHSHRLSHAGELAHELTRRVRELRMTGATIKLEVEKLSELGEFGISRVYFTAETNTGEGFYRIKDIASGGELSRILLAVRQILSQYDSISIFLFDEIDTGIGGETANSIGKALAEVSASGQVIAITHLPQIAQFADALVLVQKEILHSGQDQRTESSIREVVGKMVQKEARAMAQLH